jgi:hypothetical protein
MRTYFSPKGEREGGYHITVRAGGGGDPKGTGSLGGATTTPTAPRSIYRLHRPCCVVAYLSTNIPLPGHPPPPAAPTVCRSSGRANDQGMAGRRRQAATAILFVVQLLPRKGVVRHALRQEGWQWQTESWAGVGLHVVFAHVSWIHATFDVVAVLVLFSTISLFSPLLCPHIWQ